MNQQSGKATSRHDGGNVASIVDYVLIDQDGGGREYTARGVEEPEQAPGGRGRCHGKSRPNKSIVTAYHLEMTRDAVPLRLKRQHSLRAAGTMAKWQRHPLRVWHRCALRCSASQVSDHDGRQDARTKPLSRDTGSTPNVSSSRRKQKNQSRFFLKS